MALNRVRLTVRETLVSYCRRVREDPHLGWAVVGQAPPSAAATAAQVPSCPTCPCNRHNHDAIDDTPNDTANTTRAKFKTSEGSDRGGGGVKGERTGDGETVVAEPTRRSGRGGGGCYVSSTYVPKMNHWR